MGGKGTSFAAEDAIEHPFNTRREQRGSVA